MVRRARGGRAGEPTELARTLPAHFGLDSMYALIEALHLRRVEPVRRHELTPVLFATAAGGDPLARSVVDRQADEVVAMATVALTRLDLLAEPAPVVLGGSVLAARHPQLDQRIRELLAARAPRPYPGWWRPGPCSAPCSWGSTTWALRPGPVSGPGSTSPPEPPREPNRFPWRIHGQGWCVAPGSHQDRTKAGANVGADGDTCGDG